MIDVKETDECAVSVASVNKDGIVRSRTDPLNIPRDAEAVKSLPCTGSVDDAIHSGINDGYGIILIIGTDGISLIRGHGQSAGADARFDRRENLFRRDIDHGDMGTIIVAAMTGSICLGFRGVDNEVIAPLQTRISINEDHNKKIVFRIEQIHF